MANYTFRGLDEQAVATGDVPMPVEGIAPPLELAQLLGNAVAASAQQPAQ
jgi:hypothetical protein